MAGLEAIASLAGNTGVTGLADAWKQQMLSGTSGVSGTNEINGINGLNGTDGVTGALGVSGTSGVDPASGLDFGSILGKSLQSLEATDAVAQTKAVAAATGDLTDVHDYVIAANQAQIATELTTTIRNKALDAFSEIMRMPL